MKIYAISEKVKECYGHGDYGIELQIRQVDAYSGAGKFRPLFLTKVGAYKYLANCPYPDNLVIVELETQP